MVKIRNWPFNGLCDFLKDYGFRESHIEGSHHFYNGTIKGVQRVVQVIFSKKEKKAQSYKTMKMAIRHSGIDKKYFDEWKNNKVVHSEIIY